MDHPPDSISRCRELIAIAISQIDGDPIVSDRFVDPALEITVAHFKKIMALQRAGRRNPMTHKNAEDLTANFLVGRSVMHKSILGCARYRSYARTATVDKIAQPTRTCLHVAAITIARGPGRGVAEIRRAVVSLALKWA